MKITNGNSKLGISIPSINLPAGITCRVNAPCCKDCYAKKGNFCYSKIKNCYLENLNHFINNPDDYFDDIIKQIKQPLIIYKYIRWHSSGDIVNEEYFNGMIRVAKECKNINFLCFTKKYEIVNKYLDIWGGLPKNLHIVFSGWDENWTFDNPYNLPVALVRFKNDKRDFSKCKECSGKCYECIKCWKLKIGDTVVFNKH